MVLFSHTRKPSSPSSHWGVRTGGRRSRRPRVHHRPETHLTNGPLPGAGRDGGAQGPSDPCADRRCPTEPHGVYSNREARDWNFLLPRTELARVVLLSPGSY